MDDIWNETVASSVLVKCRVWKKPLGSEVAKVHPSLYCKDPSLSLRNRQSGIIGLALFVEHPRGNPDISVAG